MTTTTGRWNTPWGSVATIPDGMAAADAIQYAGLDWTVGLRPTYALLDPHEKRLAKIPDKRTVVRLDTETPLGVVGTRYATVQNRDAFAFLDGLADTIKIEAAGESKNGRAVWVLARHPGSDYVVGDDDAVNGYILFSTSHDGSSSVRVGLVHHRIACSNAVSRALQNGSHAMAMRHTGDVARNLRIAQDALTVAAEQTAELERVGGEMLRRAYTIEERDAFVEELIPTPEEPGGLLELSYAERKKAAAAYERAKTRAENKQGELLSMLDHPTNNVGEMGGTWWALYNSATAYADHVATGRETTAEFDRRITGSGAAFKARAEELALAAIA